MVYPRILTLLLVMMLAAPIGAVWAHQCPMHIQSIDTVLLNDHDQYDEDVIARVEELRDQGVELHEEGRHDESVEVLVQARALLDD